MLTYPAEFGEPATPGGYTTPSWQGYDTSVYQPPPAVTGVAPNSGPITGGTDVTITGTGFTDATDVKFGTVPAASFTVDSNTQITAESPPGTRGIRQIRVTTAHGTSEANVPDGRFTYTASAPTVSSINPSSGPTDGGTSVAISGTGFTAGSKVRFGTIAATNIVVNSPTQITADSPAVAAKGTRNVFVTTTGGTSAAVTDSKFTYLGPLPAITDINPSTGPTTGGTEVVITGTGSPASRG